jgi:hypothetical protein
MGERYPPRRVDQLHRSWFTQNVPLAADLRTALLRAEPAGSVAPVSGAATGRPRRARHAMTREAREDWGIDDSAGDAAALIVSEMLTNAVAPGPRAG